MRLSREIFRRAASTLAAGWLLGGFLAAVAMAQPADPRHKRILDTTGLAPGLPTDLSPEARQRMIATILDRRAAKHHRTGSSAKSAGVMSELVRTGSVLSEGDAAHHADDVKSLLGLDGTGVKVCVISDGTGGAAAAVASGDLPDDGSGGADVDLCNINNNSGAEGTAMLEIVHDLAPGAQLGFCPAFDGTGDPQSIADAIDYLAQQAFGGTGCDVIVDDVANLTEPYFQDGVVAQAVDAAVAGGVAYFSSAGNDATGHYEGEYVDNNPGDDLVFPLDVHDFGLAAGGASDLDWAGLVAGGGNFFAAFLQWNNPFGAAGDDFDLYIFDQNGFPAGHPSGIFPNGGLGLGVQDGDDDPLEFAFVVNQTASTQVFFLVVDRAAGSSDAYLEINFNGFFNVQSPENYNVAEGSVWGHAAARGAIAIAATGAVVNVDGTPNPNHDVIEPFSSLGPAVIFFTATGTPSAHRRFKPDLTAVDGVSVTGSGGFPSTFFGTSAAAPHAAAIAALILEAKPSLTPRGVIAVLKHTAVDKGPPGPDLTWGYGFIDAQAAVTLALSLP